MCGCECCISAKSIHSYLLTWLDCRLINIKDRGHNRKNQRSSEISSRIFETYKNALQSNSCRNYNITADMAMATMRPCISEHHSILHWKCVLRCCDK